MKTNLDLKPSDMIKLLDCIQDGIFLIDNTGTIVFLNKASENLTNVPKEEMLNRSVYEMVQEGIFDEDETVSIKALESGEAVHNIQKGLYGKSDILSTAIPYKEHGKIKYVIVTERDITQITTLKARLDAENARVEKYKAELEYYKLRNPNQLNIIFKSKQMQKIVDTSIHVASNDATVLIQGESGTGKEVIANIIQEKSRRNKQAFIKINCSTIPDSLIESELFGYEKGAFTGAHEKGKIGFFELANKGTLLLDEIDTIPMHLQPKLLRVLQENEFYRIGSNKQIKVDVRIIAATNSNLQDLVDKGLFRKDLYYRLNVVPISIPPLRERVDDILPLAEHFLRKFNEKYSTKKSIHHSGLLLLSQYTWPGNIRELENFIERLVVSIKDDEIDEKLIATELCISPSKTLTETSLLNQNLKDLTAKFERTIIVECMKQYTNSIELSKALGMDKSTLNRKIKQYGIHAEYSQNRT